MLRWEVVAQHQTLTPLFDRDWVWRREVASLAAVDAHHVVVAAEVVVDVRIRTSTDGAAVIGDVGAIHWCSFSTGVSVPMVDQPVHQRATRDMSPTNQSWWRRRIQRAKPGPSQKMSAHAASAR